MSVKLVTFLSILSNVFVQAKEYQVGATVELPCDVPDSFNQVRWTKSGTEIIKMGSNFEVEESLNSRININSTSGKTLGDLYIEDIQFHDDGEYICIVELPGQPSSTNRYDVSVVVSTTAPPNTTQSFTLSSGSDLEEGVISTVANVADHVASTSAFSVCALFVIFYFKCK